MDSNKVVVDLREIPLPILAHFEQLRRSLEDFAAAHRLELDAYRKSSDDGSGWSWCFYGTAYGRRYGVQMHMNVTLAEQREAILACFVPERQIFGETRTVDGWVTFGERLVPARAYNIAPSLNEACRGIIKLIRALPWRPRRNAA